MTCHSHHALTGISCERRHNCISKKVVKEMIYMCIILTKLWDLEVDLHKIYETRLIYS